MKILKRLLIIIITVIVVSPIILYFSIVITNNCIAYSIENRLKKYELPVDTVLMDSISIASKLTGNGNGMQYMGAILVESELSKEQLLEYYSNDFNYIEVREQKTEVLDFINTGYNAFSKFEKTGGNRYYSIICWDDERREFFGHVVSEILDFDIRGH